jgi:hypothetical protein
MPARVWVCTTQVTSSRAAWIALWIVKPAALKMSSVGSTTLPSRSILMRRDAVISSNSRP